MCKIIILFILFLTPSLCLLQDPVVKTTDGKILGRVETTFGNRKYYAFRKVPYAAAPIGELRFEPPQPIKKWDGILNTTHLEVCCFQIERHTNGIESEDCLFLNVFTPKLQSDIKGESLAVMVNIFGGMFHMGGSREYYPDLFVTNDVVLVTLDYRLGIFGFLSTEDNIIPGNNGLKDQIFALKWVQRNIHIFGGNSSKVTIFGHSAGAAACSYHLLNQKSPGCTLSSKNSSTYWIDLFHAAIIQSGSCLNEGTFQRDSRKTAFALAATLNSTFATNNNSEELLKYFQALNPEKLNAAAEQYTLNVSRNWYSFQKYFKYFSNTRPWGTFLAEDTLWGPVLEPRDPDAFLTKKMYGLLNTGEVLVVPVMMGITSEEAMANFLADHEYTRKIALFFDANLDKVVPLDMRIFGSENLLREGELIRKIYTGGKPFSDDLGGVIRYGSENVFSRAVIKFGEMYSKVAKTFFYQFSYDGILANVTGDRYDGTERVGHTEEMQYLFCAGTDCIDSKYPRSDLLTRQRLAKLWTNFAKHHNPTPEPEEILEYMTWPHVCAAKNSFLYLNINGTLRIRNHPKEQTYGEWVKLYDELDSDDFDTF